MKIFPSLSESPNLSDVYRQFQGVAEPLFAQVDIVMRGKSPLSIGERELIASYVSSLNTCHYCVGSHAPIAKYYGISDRTIREILEHGFSDEMDTKNRKLFEFVKKVNIDSEKITATDINSLIEQGWSEEAIFSAISVCSLFNQINRIVNSTGCSISESLEDIKPYKLDSYVEVMQNAGAIVKNG